MIQALIGLAVVVGVTVWAVRSPSWRSVGVLVAACCVWLLLNGPVEGPILWQVTADRGLTVADLLAPLVVGLATLRLLERQRAGAGR